MSLGLLCSLNVDGLTVISTMSSKAPTLRNGNMLLGVTVKEAENGLPISTGSDALTETLGTKLITVAKKATIPAIPRNADRSGENHCLYLISPVGSFLPFAFFCRFVVGSFD